MAVLFSGCAPMSGQGTPNFDDDETDSPISQQNNKETDSSEVEEATPTYRFTDVPIPSKFKMDRAKSFIYEAGSIKAGIITYSGWSGLDKLVDFYKNEMKNYEWELVNTFEHKNVTLFYSKDGWNCTVRISSGNLGRSTVEIQIGPTSAP